jgi:uncharacterized membrane protein (DUF485 family)
MIGSPGVSAGAVVRFFAHAGALVLGWMLGERLARQIGALGGGMSRLADPVLALVTLIVATSAYMVLIDFSTPLLGTGIRAAIDWTFILAILAAAGWLLWSLFQNADAMMTAIGQATARRAHTETSTRHGNFL